MCCNCCSVRQQKIWVFTIGSLLTVIGIVLITAGPSLSKSLVKSMLPLTPTSYTFDKWKVTPIDQYLSFYLYNWSNPHEVSNPNIKPHFEELGPYAFREIMVKEDIIWHSENSTVTYLPRRTWWFDPALSNGTLDDLITIPSIPSVTTSILTRKRPKFMRKIANYALNREGGSLTMTHTAIDWIFNGFYDDMFDFVYRLHSPLFPIESSEFAWFYKRNGSTENERPYTVHTGKSDLSELGNLKLINGSTHSGYWEGDCGKINGSTGELWAPDKKWDELITFFISDGERFFNMFPKEKVEYRGVNSWLYKSTDQTLDSGYIAEDTKCFCVKGRKCPENGLIDFSRVAFRAPMYLSHPHFYMTDPLYLENTTGLQPDPEKHAMHAIIEPTLGIPLDMLGHVMMSLHVEQDEYIDYLRDVAHNFYAPLFMVQMKGAINDELLSFVQLVLNLPNIAQYIGIGLTVLGVIMIAVGLWLTKAHKWRGDMQIDNEESAQANHENSENKEKGM